MAESLFILVRHMMYKQRNRSCKVHIHISHLGNVSSVSEACMEMMMSQVIPHFKLLWA